MIYRHYTVFGVGRDIEVKSQIGFYPSSKDAEAEWKQRERDRVAPHESTQKRKTSSLEGLPTHSSTSLKGISPRRVYAYLARTPSRLLIIPLEDLLGEVETPNFPGIPGVPTHPGD